MSSPPRDNNPSDSSNPSPPPPAGPSSGSSPGSGSSSDQPRPSDTTPQDNHQHAQHQHHPHGPPIGIFAFGGPDGNMPPGFHFGGGGAGGNGAGAPPPGMMLPPFLQGLPILGGNQNGGNEPNGTGGGAGGPHQGFTFFMPMPFFGSAEPRPDPAAAAELVRSLPTVSKGLFDRVDKVVIAEQVGSGDAAAGGDDEDLGWKCGVCLDGVGSSYDPTGDEGVKGLPCNHLFHKGCLQPWFETHHTCPTCRLDLDPLNTLRGSSAEERTRPDQAQGGGGNGGAGNRGHPYAGNGANGRGAGNRPGGGGDQGGNQNPMPQFTFIWHMPMPSPPVPTPAGEGGQTERNGSPATSTTDPAPATDGQAGNANAEPSNSSSSAQTQQDVTPPSPPVPTQAPSNTLSPPTMTFDFPILRASPLPMARSASDPGNGNRSPSTSTSTVPTRSPPAPGANVDNATVAPGTSASASSSSPSSSGSRPVPQRRSHINVGDIPTPSPPAGSGHEASAGQPQFPSLSQILPPFLFPMPGRASPSPQPQPQPSSTESQGVHTEREPSPPAPFLPPNPHPRQAAPTGAAQNGPNRPMPHFHVVVNFTGGGGHGPTTPAANGNTDIGPHTPGTGQAPQATTSAPPRPSKTIVRESLDTWVSTRERALGWRCDAPYCSLAPTDEEPNHSEKPLETISILSPLQTRPTSMGADGSKGFELHTCSHRWHRQCLEMTAKASGRWHEGHGDDDSDKVWTRCEVCRKDGWVPKLGAEEAAAHPSETGMEMEMEVV